MERELAEMTGSLEQLAGLEEKEEEEESGSSVRGLSCSRGRRGGGVWWEGEVCRSGEGMWDSAGNGTVRWHV